MPDFARALRSIARRPSYGALTFLLIALATTATAATFAVVRATLWRDLPYRDPSALLNIYTLEPVGRDSSQQLASSATMLARWRQGGRSFTSIEGFTPVNVSVAGDGDPESLTGAFVSAGLFELLGTPPAVGRAFRGEEEVPASGVIIISNAVAQRRFESATAALGRTLTIEGEPREVVGVMPPGFSLLFQGGDAWIPIDLSVEQQARPGIRNIAVYGRLRPGVSPTQARSELDAGLRDLVATVPTYAPTQVAVRPLREQLFGDRRPTMLVLGIAVGLVLLIALVNVANLTLADALARRTQTMTRVALGARPAALVRSRVNEVATLALPAFVVSLPLAAGVLAILSTVSPEALVALGGRHLDASVLGVALLTAAALGAWGALPAVVVESRTGTAGIAGTVTKAGQGSDGRLRMVLGTAQALVTVVLLSLAALLGRDLVKLMSTSTGLSAEQVMVVRMNVLSRERGTVPARAQYADALTRSVSAVPGVVDVSGIQSRFILNETMQSPINIEDRPTPPDQPPFSQIRHVMPNVFRVLGVRVLAGRGIDSTDRADSRPVVVVNESFAKLYWPGESAIGKRVKRTSAGAPWLEVVGVVGDVMDAGIGVPLGPVFYVSYLQQNTATARLTLVARTRGGTPPSSDAIRRAIWSVNPSQAIDDVTTLPALMSRSAAQPRFRAIVVGVFGVSAVALVLAGVYAITLFNVLSRRREFGIRAAIGASPARLVLLATRNSLKPVIIGGAIGAVLTIPVTTLMRGIIQSQLRGEDVFLSLASVLLLLGTATGAALIPARRAARVPPTEAIRAD